MLCCANLIAGGGGITSPRRLEFRESPLYRVWDGLFGEHRHFVALLGTSVPRTAKFGGANSSSIELGVKTRKVVFWSILEHMGHKEHGGTWHMEAAQLDTQRKKGEAILKTSSTVYSTNRSSSSTRPAKLQLDRAEKSKSNPKNVASPLTFL
ncbi:unnamed protein product [Microthlaspi erraticum]|uniref:Uncharacterized protein n=1 Tax=Microthlaspi erraticum TaxID=1685480 RepID=A0A6D2K6G5_9BRAS|nr:unnamed protein product [Microthlaspi erraticum]